MIHFIFLMTNVFVRCVIFWLFVNWLSIVNSNDFKWLNTVQFYVENHVGKNHNFKFITVLEFWNFETDVLNFLNGRVKVYMNDYLIN